jgi:DNA-binding HxlR family transcriptional regulator
MSHSHIRVPEAVVDDACPLTEVLDRVSGKWSIGILITARPRTGPLQRT